MKRSLFYLAALFSIHSLHAADPSSFFTLKARQRQMQAAQVKFAVAGYDEGVEVKEQRTNGDQQRYENYRGSFGVGLDHFVTGYLQPKAFQSLVRALQQGKGYKDILLGGERHLVNPQGALAFSLAGNDSWIRTIAPAPAFASQEMAGEMVELYWSALLRDVPFDQFDTNLSVAEAVAELNRLSDFKGPKLNGLVTSKTVFRGHTAGDLIGPYISQFLLQPVPYGITTISPEQIFPSAGTANDFNTLFSDWFTVVNGGTTGQTITFDPSPRLISTPRDLSEYVHLDFPGQPFLNAALILNSYGKEALDPNNPYLNNATQSGFVTFGLADVLFLLQAAVQEALKAAWYQKWLVHLRLRPEEFGFYVQQRDPEIHSELIKSKALAKTVALYGSSFLPMAYPEGSPLHPAYPSGHAASAGAAATILKAFFNENFVIPNPVQYSGNLTIGGELNKLASNSAFGRNFAGVHYRSDAWQGMLLGEQVAIDVLKNHLFLYHESFKGFRLTRFNGELIQIVRP